MHIFQWLLQQKIQGFLHICLRTAEGNKPYCQIDSIQFFVSPSNLGHFKRDAVHLKYGVRPWTFGSHRADEQQ